MFEQKFAFVIVIICLFCNLTLIFTVFFDFYLSIFKWFHNPFIVRYRYSFLFTLWKLFQLWQDLSCYVFNCSWTKFIAIVVNVCLFMQNFCLTILTFRVTFTPWTFCFSRDLKFSLKHNFKQLNSICGKLILKVKWKVRRKWCRFLL